MKNSRAIVFLICLIMKYFLGRFIIKAAASYYSGKE